MVRVKNGFLQQTPLAAYQVFSDARLALEFLNDERELDRWRVHWAGGAALLRAVGHVLFYVDRPADSDLARIADAAYGYWRSDDPSHRIYRDFICEERNNILKEYRSKVDPLVEVPVLIRMTLMNLETGEPQYVYEVVEIDGNDFRPIVERHGKGEGARDVFREAID